MKNGNNNEVLLQYRNEMLILEFAGHEFFTLLRCRKTFYKKSSLKNFKLRDNSAVKRINEINRLNRMRFFEDSEYGEIFIFHYKKSRSTAE